VFCSGKHWCDLQILTRLKKTPLSGMRRNIMFAKTFGMLGLAVAMSSSSLIAQASEGVVYQGDNEAKNVCLSIVQDDPSQLNAALRWDRIKSRQLGDNKENFRCNDMALVDFANDIGAYNVSRYLDGNTRGTVHMEEVAAR